MTEQEIYASGTSKHPGEFTTDFICGVCLTLAVLVLLYMTFVPQPPI